MQNKLEFDEVVIVSPYSVKTENGNTVKFSYIIQKSKVDGKTTFTILESRIERNPRNEKICGELSEEISYIPLGADFDIAQGWDLNKTYNTISSFKRIAERGASGEDLERVERLFR